MLEFITREFADMGRDASSVYSFVKLPGGADKMQKVYAETIEIDPPLFGLTWGMPEEEALGIVADKGELYQPVITLESGWALNAWDGTVCGLQTYTGDTSPYSGSFINTVSFDFTSPFLYNGKEIPAVLSSVSVLVQADSVEEVLKKVEDTTRIHYTPVGRGYKFADIRTPKNLDAVTFCHLLNMNTIQFETREANLFGKEVRQIELIPIEQAEEMKELHKDDNGWFPCIYVEETSTENVYSLLYEAGILQYLPYL